MRAYGLYCPPKFLSCISIYVSINQSGLVEEKRGKKEENICTLHSSLAISLPKDLKSMRDFY